MTEESIIPDGFKHCECGCNELIKIIDNRGRTRRYKNHHFGKGKFVPKGPDSWNWTGGSHVASNGYRMVYKPEHSRANCRGYVYEHIIILEEKLGRSLLSNEHSHHINHNKLDNRPENLINMDMREHGSFHGRRSVVGIIEE